MKELLMKFLFLLGLFILAGFAIALFIVIGIPFLLISLIIELMKWLLETINDTLVWLRNYFFY